MTVLELLGENGEHWLKWAMASTATHECVSAEDPRASRWCLLGALICCYGRDDGGVCGESNRKVLAAIRRRWVGWDTVHAWNDNPGRSWPEVRAVVEEAGV